MNQTEQNPGTPTGAGSLTSYGLPARIDGFAPAQLHALLAEAPVQVNEIGAGGQVTVGFDDPMELARRLIAEQLDDCDEEFLAGRAHGIGSLHSEILMLAKRGALALAQAQDETEGDAGSAPTCRSSASARLQKDEA